MKTVFFCASEYGMECLEQIYMLKQCEIIGIFTTPEAFVLKSQGGTKEQSMRNPIWRKLHDFANKYYIPIFSTTAFNGEVALNMLKQWNPELIVVSGWYHIIKTSVLELPAKGVIGLHASLLPKYRGGAPLVWQMIQGEEKVGITLFYMDEGIDSGDIIGQHTLEIKNEDTIKTLYQKIGEAGIDLLIKYIPLIEMGTAPRTPQLDLREEDVWPLRTPEDGKINWNKSPREIENFVRAQTKPYPGAFTVIEDKKVTIWDCTVEEIKVNDKLF